MVGVGRTTRDETLVGLETLWLRVVDGRLVLTAAPLGQAPTDFRAVAATARLLRVENSTHDFPQAIEYVRNANDALLARVFAEVAAEDPAFTIHYRRGRCPSTE